MSNAVDVVSVVGTTVRLLASKYCRHNHYYTKASVVASCCISISRMSRVSFIEYDAPDGNIVQSAHGRRV